MSSKQIQKKGMVHRVSVTVIQSHAHIMDPVSQQPLWPTNMAAMNSTATALPCTSQMFVTWLLIVFTSCQSPTLFKLSLSPFVFAKHCYVLILCQAVILCLYLQVFPAWSLVYLFAAVLTLSLHDPVLDYVWDLFACEKIPAFRSCSRLLLWQHLVKTRVVHWEYDLFDNSGKRFLFSCELWDVRHI